MRLPAPAPDKALHLVYGNLIAFVGVLMGMLAGWALSSTIGLPYFLALVVRNPWAVGLVCVVALAVWKEWFDGATGTGTRDKYDAIATILGGLPVVIIAVLGKT